MSPKSRRFWPLFAVVLLTDCATKRAAELHLVPAHVPHEFLGEVVRLTLAYNPGAAMSLSLGVSLPRGAFRCLRSVRCS